MDYSSINDYELLYLAKDEDDFYKKIVYDKYNPIIDKYAFNLSRKYNTSYEDLYSEGLVAICYAIKNYKENYSSSFFTFVSICIRSKMYDYIKKEYSFSNRINIDCISLSKLVTDNKCLEDFIPDRNYNDFANDIYLYNFVVDFKNSLDFRDSQVFELVVNGFKYKEIGRLLDIKTSTVGSIVRKIKKRFAYNNNLL